MADHEVAQHEVAEPPNEGGAEEEMACGCGKRDPRQRCGQGRVASPSPYVYAVGRIEPRLPSLGVEKEFAQAAGRAEMVNLTDRQILHSVLSAPQNRYLNRQLCYVMVIQGLETYVVRPREFGDYDLLVEALVEAPRPTDLHVVIGVQGPAGTSDRCGGLLLPPMLFDQIYAFDADALVRSLPTPDGMDETHFQVSAGELFERLIQVADNTGSSDEHRALNYLAVRYSAIYEKGAESFAQGFTLSAVETCLSRLSAARKIVDVLFSYTNRKTDVTEKCFARVDVTEEFPFLVTKLSPYYDR
ncbi:cyanobactin maturation protease PatG family protein [Streptomyces sp. NPDC001436]